MLVVALYTIYVKIGLALQRRQKLRGKMLEFLLIKF